MHRAGAVGSPGQNHPAGISCEIHPAQREVRSRKDACSLMQVEDFEMKGIPVHQGDGAILAPLAPGCVQPVPPARWRLPGEKSPVIRRAPKMKPPIRGLLIIELKILAEGHRIRPALNPLDDAHIGQGHRRDGLVAQFH
jgi:hypothetical protein